MATSFVYVVGTSTNPVKIGHGEDVATRICQLQIGNPDELILHKAVVVPWHLAAQVERDAHTLLAKYHRRGEWFNVDADFAAGLVTDLAKAAMEEHQATVERADLDRDIFGRMRARNWLHDAAREAVEFYVSERKVNRDAKAVKTMNRYILQETGPTCLTVFQQVFIENRSLEYHAMGVRLDIERGYVNLAKAVNALADYYEHRKRVQSERLWGAHPRATNLVELKAAGAAMTAAELREETRQRKLASQTAAISKAKPAA